jgi:hypothetical protein
MLIALLIFAASLLVVSGASATGGVEYKLHLTAEGKESVSSISPNLEQETRQQNATWTLLPKDVNVWIPKFNGPPPQGVTLESEVQTADERLLQSPFAPIGKIEEHGTYFAEPGTEPVAEPFECSGSVVYDGPIIHRVIVSPLSGAVDLETDFQGVIASASKGTIGNTVGEPCYTAEKGEEGWGYFYYAWGEPGNERIQVGMSIEPLEIGQPFISGPAKDFSSVEIQKASQDCLGSNECEETFKLTGEYDLEKICEGTNATGTFACESGSSGSSSNNNSNKPQTNPGGGKQAEEEAKKKEEAAKSAAVKKQEEKKKEEEKKRQAEEEAKASVKIESVKLTAAGLLVKVNISESGTLTISGAGLKKVSRSLAAGGHTLKVSVNKKARAKHFKTKLTVSLKVDAKTVAVSKKLQL